MAKRHTAQTHQQKMGQYFTTNADYILDGYESVVKNKTVIDPFAGGKDLLNWASRCGASNVIGYDLEPKSDDITQNDSIANPPQYSGVVVSNPPYLSKNKFKGDKGVFDQWGQNDLYKCHLASLSNCDEAIVIIPSNFLCEGRATAREMLFKTHYIVSAKYWNTPVFEDATTGICVIHIKKGVRPYQRFQLYHGTENTSFEMKLEKRYNYLHGKDFLEIVQSVSGKFKVVKTDVGMSRPNTNIVLGLLDKGAWRLGLSYNEGEAIYCSPKSFTTYQLTLPGKTLSEDDQRKLVKEFNEILVSHRDRYHDMFLSNFMGPKQKILSRKMAHSLIEYIIFGPKKWLTTTSTPAIL